MRYFCSNINTRQQRANVKQNLMRADKHLYDSNWEIEFSKALDMLNINAGTLRMEVDLPRETAALGGPGAPTSSPVVLDLRAAVHFAHGHIPSAWNYPLRSLEKYSRSPYDDSELLERQWLELEELFARGEWQVELFRRLQSRPVVLVCYKGDTARVGSSVLRARGVEALSIRGGMDSIMQELTASL